MKKEPEALSIAGGAEAERKVSMLAFQKISTVGKAKRRTERSS